MLVAYSVLLSELLDEAHHFPAGCRVQTTGRLIQKEYFWTCHELGSNADSPFLASRDSFPDRSPNDSVCLVMETEGQEKPFNAGFTFRFTNRAESSQESKHV